MYVCKVIFKIVPVVHVFSIYVHEIPTLIGHWLHNRPTYNIHILVEWK